MARMRYQTHLKECEHCGATFRASRYDAKYCPSPATCRQQASRAAKRREKLGDKLWNAYMDWFDFTVRSDVLTADEAQFLSVMVAQTAVALKNRRHQKPLFEDENEGKIIWRDNRQKANTGDKN